MATSPINKTQPMREAEQDIADYLNETVALYMVQETQERKNADSKLTSDLASEVTNRENAFTSLKGDLNSETGARSDADSLLQGNIDLVNGKFPVKTDNIGNAQVTKAKLHESLQLLLDYLETLPDVEYGYKDVGTLAAGSTTTTSIVFDSTKTEAPMVFVTPVANGNNLDISAYTQYTTTTNAVIVIRNNGSVSVSNITLDYLALSGR